MKNRLIAQLGAVALAAMSLGVATPAVAAGPTPGPSDASCNTWKTSGAPWGGSAYCSGMAWGDEFRVKLVCISPHGSTFNVYGPWKNRDQTSSAICSNSPDVGVLSVSVQQEA